MKFPYKSANVIKIPYRSFKLLDLDTTMDKGSPLWYGLAVDPNVSTVTGDCVVSQPISSCPFRRYSRYNDYLRTLS
jgi:hypothetical protein